MVMAAALYLPVGQGADALARFGVPVAHEPVEARRQEVAPVVGEVRVADPRGVAGIRALARALVVRVPNFHLRSRRAQRGTQQVVRRINRERVARVE